MKITEILKSEKPVLSFEVFPPKGNKNYENIKLAVDEIAKLKPSFISVTYGANGSNAGYAAETSSQILEKGITALAHMTCVASKKEEIHKVIDNLCHRGIENIFALRGDLPEGFLKENLEYAHASDLISDIKSYAPELCIGGACYPEVHPESKSIKEDIESLKIKVECGCEFLTTQVFFDNQLYYDLANRILSAGINVKVIPGIMPITNESQLKHIVELSGGGIPLKFRKMIERFGSDSKAMKQAGIAFATEQIIDLYANGAVDVHVCTMNKPDVAVSIKSNISSILGE